VDFASTQSQANGVAPSANHEGGQTEATMIEPQNASPPPTAMRWIGCTTNWQRSTPSQPCN
jgi:hypothetical protein